MKITKKYLFNICKEEVDSALTERNRRGRRRARKVSRPGHGRAHAYPGSGSHGTGSRGSGSHGSSSCCIQNSRDIAVLRRKVRSEVRSIRVELAEIAQAMALRGDQ